MFMPDIPHDPKIKFKINFDTMQTPIVKIKQPWYRRWPVIRWLSKKFFPDKYQSLRDILTNNSLKGEIDIPYHFINNQQPSKVDINPKGLLK